MRKYLKIVAIAVLGASSLMARAEAPVRVTVKAQPIAAALNDLARQIGLHVVIDSQTARGVTSKAIDGTFTADIALQRILADTGLRYEYLDARTVAVRSVKEGGASSVQEPSDQMMLASVDDKANGKNAPTSAAREEERQVTVEGQREKPKPFSDRDVDLPRTMDDAQAYYIFDTETLRRSGAVNVEDFMKKRLTMNTTAFTNTQNAQNAGDPSASSASSSFNLRGLGTNKTLVLVNGRRLSGVGDIGAGRLIGQPDVNGLPLDAIERIEVLPTSAAGIYGGSAVGGVINIVLRRDYNGGEARLTYDNAWDADSPNRTLSATYGLSLEEGKTGLMFSGQWTDSDAMLFGQRRGIYETNLAGILRRDPEALFYSFEVPLGSQTNIRAAGGSLVLKDGRSLGSTITHLPAGTSLLTDDQVLADGLFANRGAYDTALPETNQSPVGLLRPILKQPRVESAQMTVHRRMSTRWELYGEFSYSGNDSEAAYNPFGQVRVAANAPDNPFVGAVDIRYPYLFSAPAIANLDTRNAVVGARVDLPYQWTAQLDYSWSQTRGRYRYEANPDNFALMTDINAGTINPFVDLLSNPPALSDYLIRQSYANTTQLKDYSVRGAGPVFSLPWGTPQMAVGLERRIASIPAYTSTERYSRTVENSTRIQYFPLRQNIDSVYGEAEVPLLKSDRFPWVHALSLQIAGRLERYTVDDGTAGQVTSTDSATPYSYYIGPTLNSAGEIVQSGDGTPFTSEAKYSSKNYTAGLKYQVNPSLTVRVSSASAFTPPQPQQLVPLPGLDNSNTYIFSDPQNPDQGFEFIPALVGGNPDLKPETSKSAAAGLIWQPQTGYLKGLRFNVEYSRVRQFDAIASFDAQTLVDSENSFPDRVVRDANGEIIQVNVRPFNLYRKEMQAWDVGVQHTLSNAIGSFDFSVNGTWLRHLKTQFSASQPEYDAAGYSPGDLGAPKVKTNADVVWTRRAFTAGWSINYWSSYKQVGAAGGPTSMESYGGAEDPTLINRQGSNSIASQAYHDLFLGYEFAAPVGLKLQAGIRNVFDKVPPFDAAYPAAFYVSPYGDVRLRTYWLSLRRSF